MTIHPPGGSLPTGPESAEALFGSPVLDEVPELASALRSLLAADRAIAAAIDQLVHLRRGVVVEAATGVGPEGWLAIVARRTGTDRRMLLTVVDTLLRLPHLHRCFAEGALSWAQLRSVVLQVHRLTAFDPAELDTALAGAVADTADLEPDALPRQVRWIVADLLAGQLPIEAPSAEQHLHLQPRLDGSGGTVYGDLGPVGLAALDAATRPPTGADQPARRRAEALTELCLHATEARRGGGTAATPARAEEAGSGGAHAGGPTTGAGRARRSDVQLLLRVELETLVGHDQRPAQLLTGLAGGAMWTDAPTARRLARDAASLRLVVTDGGAPVGVGRRSSAAPRWLRETLLALHDTCTAPGCTRPALTADVDHATEWSAGGTTDVGNLAPLCAHHNRATARRAWRIAQAADGSRRWSHPRSGLTTATRPDRPPRAAPARLDRPGGATDEQPRGPHPAGPDSRRQRPPPDSRAA